MKTQHLIKIIFIFVILCLAINSSTLAQIYEDHITGNVGINTMSPGAKLNIRSVGVLKGPLSGGENEVPFLNITGYNDDTTTVFLSAIDKSGDLDFQLKMNIW